MNCRNKYHRELKFIVLKSAICVLTNVIRVFRSTKIRGIPAIYRFQMYEHSIRIFFFFFSFEDNRFL